MIKLNRVFLNFLKDELEVVPLLDNDFLNTNIATSLMTCMKYIPHNTKSA